MKPFIQSNLSPGNCWQTAVACILEVEPSSLPDQVAIEASGDRSYGNAMRAYLRKHHGLSYYSLESFTGLAVADPGWHLLEGPTVRTPTNGGIEHVVVGRYGQMVHDPHPSGAGLTEIRRWGMIAEEPPQWRRAREAQVAAGNARWLEMERCWCPTCGGAT